MTRKPKTPDQLAADCMCSGQMCQSCWDDMRAGQEAEVRRLRAEVRRLRRVILTPAGLGRFATCRYCGAGMPMPCDSRRIKHHPGCIAKAALARRKGSK